MNAYTEIDINGKTASLYFGLPAFAQVSKDIQFLGESNEFVMNMGGIVSVLNAGHENWAMVERKKPLFSFKDFYEYVEQQFWTGEPSEELTSIMHIFANARTVKPTNGQLEIEKKN